VGSLIIGLVMASLMTARNRLVSGPIAGLATFVRTTPPLLQLYLVYFGIGGLTAAALGFTFNALIVSSVVLATYAGAANAYAIYDAVTELRRRRPDRKFDRAMAIQAMYFA